MSCVCYEMISMQWRESSDWRTGQSRHYIFPSGTIRHSKSCELAIIDGGLPWIASLPPSLVGLALEQRRNLNAPQSLKNAVTHQFIYSHNPISTQLSFYDKACLYQPRDCPFDTLRIISGLFWDCRLLYLEVLGNHSGRVLLLPEADKTLQFPIRGQRITVSITSSLLQPLLFLEETCHPSRLHPFPPIPS